MKNKEFERLYEKFKLNHVLSCQRGKGFLEGLQYAEKHYEKKNPTKKAR